MDHNSASNKQAASQQQVQTNNNFDAYVTENGEKFRVPYRIIKRVVFENVKKEELIDIPHSARLQYRLMLMDPILKASVNFTKNRIIVIYNPDTADNNKEKISLLDLVEVLKKEGVHVNLEEALNEDYDYYKDFYTYAYAPPSIRESAPYGYTMEQWKEMKPEWQQKMQKGEEEKKAKFRAFQEAYLEDHPEMAQKIEPGWKKAPESTKTLKEKILGKKKSSGGKGFWFHGI